MKTPGIVSWTDNLGARIGADALQVFLRTVLYASPEDRIVQCIYQLNMRDV